MAQKIKYNDGEPINPVYFDEYLLAPVQGNTPFGRYDDDPAFIADAKKVARWAARRLGYPTVDIEMDERDFYAAFEEAVDQYSAIISEQLTIDNLYTMLGTNRNEDITGTFVTGSPVAQMVKLARAYGNMVGSGGNITWKRGSINIQRGKQAYNIPELFKEENDTNRNIIVKRIFHNEKPAIKRFFDPSADSGIAFSNIAFQNEIGGSVAGGTFGHFSTPSEFVLMPIFTSLQRIQNIEFADMVFRSHYSFELTGGTVRLFPIPRRNHKLWFDYVYEDEELNIDVFGTPTSASIAAASGEMELVSSFADAPFDFLRYGVINAAGRRWIWRYALAVAKHKLGLIRSKYDSVPSPQDNFRLDGTDLRQQAIQDMRDLLEALERKLEMVSRESMMRRNNEEGQQLNEYLNRIPMKIYIG